jgi:hypothetical protein
MRWPQDLGVSVARRRLLDGQLAWRQHDGGHTDGPNWKHFIAWAEKFLGRPPRTKPPADRAVARTGADLAPGRTRSAAGIQ